MIGTIIILVVVVAVLAVALGGIALDALPPALGRPDHDRQRAAECAAEPAAAGACCRAGAGAGAGAGRGAGRGAGGPGCTAFLPEPSRWRARSVQRCCVRAAVRSH